MIESEKSDRTNIYGVLHNHLVALSWMYKIYQALELEGAILSFNW